MSDLVTRLSVLAEDDGDRYPAHVKKLAEAAASRITALEAANKRADEAEALVRMLEDAETVEIIQTLRARVAELEASLAYALNEYDLMIWGEDYEYRNAGERVQEIIEAALKGVKE